ncbi:MAG: class I SAM-dependent methyltransferase [Deltaproteobacteria bacterium]|nr:class I SAM-dependent methyltransferase [Deltaproteobacteria bacterium]
MDFEKANTLTLSMLEEAPAYNRWVFEKFRPYLGEDLLEIGCGLGNLTGFLLGEGRVFVADINASYLRTVSHKFQSHVNLKGVFLWDIQQKLSQNLHFPADTIVCSNVLEHVEDGDAVLRNFYQLLPRGGRLILLLPALKALYNALDRELGHFRRYHKKEVIQKLAGNGFRILHLNYFNMFGIWGWFFNGTILRKRLLSLRQIRIFNQMVPFFAVVEKIIPTFMGQSLIAVGEKD